MKSSKTKVAGKKDKKKFYSKQKIVSPDFVGYDEEKRSEFVLGFHKRKEEEKKKRNFKITESQKQEKRESRKAKRDKLAAVMPMLQKLEEINKDVKVKKIADKQFVTTVTITEGFGEEED
jgi:ribosomal RNA-processing protein 17